MPGVYAVRRGEAEGHKGAWQEDNEQAGATRVALGGLIKSIWPNAPFFPWAITHGCVRYHRWSRGRWYLAVRSDTYLGLLVPGVVITLVGAFSIPAAMAACIRARNASSMSK